MRQLPWRARTPGCITSPPQASCRIICLSKAYKKQSSHPHQVHKYVRKVCKDVLQVVTSEARMMREQGLGTGIKTNNRRRQQQHITLIWRVFCPQGENVHLLFMEHMINFWKRKIIAIELYSFIYRFIRLSEHLLCARHERWWKLQLLPTGSSRAIREGAGPPAWYSYWGGSHVSWWKKVTAQKEKIKWLSRSTRVPGRHWVPSAFCQGLPSLNKTTMTTELANKQILGDFKGISIIWLRLEFTKEYYSTEDGLQVPQI